MKSFKVWKNKLLQNRPKKEFHHKLMLAVANYHKRHKVVNIFNKVEYVIQ